MEEDALTKNAEQTNSSAERNCDGAESKAECSLSCDTDLSLPTDINKIDELNNVVDSVSGNQLLAKANGACSKSSCGNVTTDVHSVVTSDTDEKSESFEDGSKANMKLSGKELLPPEYDEHLNHVFFLKSSLTNKEVTQSEALQKEFFQSYKLFFENRQELINELRDIADEVIQIQQGCNISHIVGGTLGIAGGATALVGTVAFPPLLFGGLVVAGFATLTNLGTSLTQFFVLRNLIQKVSKISKYDISLLETLEDVYKLLISSNLFDIVERLADGTVKKLHSTNLQLGLDGARSGALAIGIRSLGAGMVEISSGVLKGVGRSAVGIGVIIDGVTIYICADDLAKGGNSQLSEALRKLADEKEIELDTIKRKVSASGLFTAKYESEDSYLVLSRSKMASLL